MWRPRHGIILSAISLLGIGLIVSQSAGLSVGATDPITVADVLFGSTARKAAGAVLLLVGAMFLPVDRLGDRRWLATPLPWVALIAIALVLSLQIPGVGVRRNGAVRWMEFGPVGFQPSELAKWCVPLALAWWAARCGRNMDRFWRGLVPPLAILGLTAAAVGIEDLGTAVVIAAVGGAVLLAGGVRVGHVAWLVPTGLGLAVVGVLAEDYRRNRILAFLDPFEDPEGLNYHMIQSLTAITGGGTGGRGLGNGLQKFGYLLEDTTDFIYAVVCEELGLAGAALVLFLLSALVCSCLAVARRTASPFGRLVAFAVTATIGLQSLVNLAVVTGLAPTKGIALPLVSHGGTGWWMTAACLGLVCAVDRAADRRSSPIAEDDGTPVGVPAADARTPAGGRPRRRPVRRLAGAS